MDYEFTDEQEEAIGQLVTDRWGDNFQTGFDQATTHPELFSQTGPNHPVRSAVIARDGTVIFK
jgi:hypothetical protein